MSSFLSTLANFRPDTEPIRVTLIEGEPDIEFRKPMEGESDKARKDAEQEAEVYFKQGFQPTAKQAEWLPSLRESFVKATVLSKFIVHDSKDKLESRRLLCQVAKYRPMVFEAMFNQFTEKSVIAEVKDFADKVNEAKKSSLMTGSDSTD